MKFLREELEELPPFEISPEYVEVDTQLELIAKALNNKTRRFILWTLLDRGELSLSQLVSELNLSKEKHKPLLHYHLRILEKAGLIEVSRIERSGLTISAKFYQLSEKTRNLLTQLLYNGSENRSEKEDSLIDVKGKEDEGMFERLTKAFTRAIQIRLPSS